MSTSIRSGRIEGVIWMSCETGWTSWKEKRQQTIIGKTGVGRETANASLFQNAKTANNRTCTATTVLSVVRVATNSVTVQKTHSCWSYGEWASRREIPTGVSFVSG